MSWMAAAVVGGSVAGGLIASNGQKSAAKSASGAQLQATQLGIDQQNKQFEAVQKLLSPYASAGTGALAQQQALLGLGTPSSVDWAAYVQKNPDALANWNSIVGTSSDAFGGDIAKFGQYHYQKDGAQRDLSPFTTAAVNGVDAQRAAISGISNSPLFAEMQKQGENAILQNASATGGLRGGNTQGVLEQFRPQLLAQLIDQQYQRLGGLTSIGQNAAAGVGNAGMQVGNQITGLLGQQGAARAGAALAEGRANAQFGNTIGGAVGQFAGMGGFSGFGGSSAPVVDAPTNIIF